MKKIVYFLLFALCLPIGLLAQSVDDDLYFVPSKDKQEKKETPVKKETKQQVTNIYTSPGTTVVVQDRREKHGMWMNIIAVTMHVIMSS